jgi:cytochrome c6
MRKAERLKGSILVVAIILALSYAAMSNSTATSSAGLAGADGNAIYSSKCAICHGKDGRGMPNWRSKGQPDFTDPKWQKAHTDAQIADATKNGKGKYMPAFKSKLSDEEITAVVARIRTFAKK